MTTMYMIELKAVKDTTTNKTTYLQRICGVWQRISKVKYYKLTSYANRSDSFSTEIKGNKVHQYGTYYYYSLDAIAV
ncbi:hypothetical protein P9J96_000228 [Escherichia coli]|nr:hypothetical protein [Escherichia coli]ELQ3159044.1 hypothetical protein [Escherichia coli]MDI1114264.1 hypothetical protein [Escherichia coli]QDF14159.1 hypothetical protein vBEcoMphAPEC6_gp536c [Escherichia phage vB_EcoM_phAPEC6]